VLSALVAALLAQPQAPLPRGAPQELVAPAVRVHVRAHEDLDPDRLRSLARPGVTLWLDTRSNTLRASTLEHLARFDQAWVRLRAPLRPVDAATFARLPAAGAWLGPADLEVARRLPGARRVAVELSGPLDEAVLERVAAARPAELRWTPAGPLSLLDWGHLARVPGRRVVVPQPGAVLPVRCDARKPGEPGLELHVASLLSLSADAFPCGQGTRVLVLPEVEPWLLQSLVTRDPSVELVVEVGTSAARAKATAGLLERLGLGPFR
jgi:hypothetical protein